MVYSRQTSVSSDGHFLKQCPLNPGTVAKKKGKDVETEDEEFIPVDLDADGTEFHTNNRISGLEEARNTIETYHASWEDNNAFENLCKIQPKVNQTISFPKCSAIYR